MIRKNYIIHKFLILSDYLNIVQILIDNYQLAAGITTPILENIHGDTPYVTSILLDNLIKYLQRSKIKLKLRDNFTLIPDRYNTTNVMQGINNTYISIKTKTRFNACRMYLRVIYLSEI